MSPSNSLAVGLSLMLQDGFRQASQPLFDGGHVDIVEWSFDMVWGAAPPPWLNEILHTYSQLDRLLGHGVSYSVLDASETDRQDRWLQQLQVELSCFRYQHLSEHFGFMGGGHFHMSSPLPVPRTKTSIRIGQERLRRLAGTAGVPVGLENLAFAFNAADVQQQGPFLDELLEPVNGFLLLDLHNLYCQSVNFGVEMLTLLESYPLQRVRELHVSGGSWSEHPEGAGRVRRDTHDDRVPAEVFAVLPQVLQRCPNVQAVILERLDGTLDVENSIDIAGFRSDFMRLKEISNEARP